MAGLLINIIRAVRGKNRKKLKEKVKTIVEKDRLLQKKFAKAS